MRHPAHMGRDEDRLRMLREQIVLLADHLLPCEVLCPLRPGSDAAAAPASARCTCPSDRTAVSDRRCGSSPGSCISRTHPRPDPAADHPPELACRPSPSRVMPKFFQTFSPIAPFLMSCFKLRGDSFAVIGRTDTLEIDIGHARETRAPCGCALMRIEELLGRSPEAARHRRTHHDAHVEAVHVLQQRVELRSCPAGACGCR